MPRAGLTPGRVVDEAERLVDAHGWEALTLALLADSLGVRPPSLYKHVPSLPALRGRLAARATADLADAMAAGAVGRSRGAALSALAHAYRGYASAHPGLYLGTVSAPSGDDPERQAAAQHAVEVARAVVQGYGVRAEDEVHAVRAVRAALHGFVSLEQSHAFGMPEDRDASFDRLVTGLDAMLTSWTAP